MQIVLSADSENQVHSSQLADGKLHFLLLFAAAVPYSLGRFGVYSSFSFELLYIQTSLFAMCSDARDTTPNAKCCWCRQQEGRSLRPVGRERGLSAFSHCFWKEQFHTIWRRFNVDSSFLIILIYIQREIFAMEFRCQRQDPKCMVLFVLTAKRALIRPSWQIGK